MTGQIAGPSMFSLELVGLVVGIVDDHRGRRPDTPTRMGLEAGRGEQGRLPHPRAAAARSSDWASTSSQGRPKVAPITAAGRAASLPFEQFGDEADHRQRQDGRPAGTVRRPMGLGSFGGRRTATDRGRPRRRLVGDLGGGRGRPRRRPRGGLVGDLGGQGVMLETEPVTGPRRSRSAPPSSAPGVATRTARSPIG